MEPINQYRPSWVEPEFMETIGFELVKDRKDGYLQYRNDGKTFKDEDYNSNGPLPKGKRLVFFNCTYSPQQKVVFVGIREDGDTRTVYNGICNSEEFLKQIINSVK